MSLQKFLEYCESAGITAIKNEPLKKHCTFKIGGPASLFIEADGEKRVKNILKTADELGVRLFVLGNGSNVLFSDDGFDGAILHIGKGLDYLRLIDETTIEAGSGTSLKALCSFAADNSLAGLEFAYGIPGSVGGAVYMNAGAYGGEMKDVLVSVNHLSVSGETGSLSGDDMGLSYRRSAYCGGGFVITSAVLKLTKGNKSEIFDRMNDYLGRRRDKQPLDIPSAGSTFKRPETGYASALIDECGLKGRSVGGAAVSEKHAGFVVNTGGATCQDVMELIEIIKTEVWQKKGIQLECEIRTVI